MYGDARNWGHRLHRVALLLDETHHGLMFHMEFENKNSHFPEHRCYNRVGIDSISLAECSFNSWCQM